MRRSRDLAGLVERLSYCTYSEAYRDGLKPAQWSALRYFSNANRISSTTTAYARYQGTTLAAASQTIGVLVGKRLLKRTRDKADKRRYQLTLTAKAKRLIDSDPIGVLVDAACELGEGEREATADGLDKILIHLMRLKGGAIFGHCESCRFLSGVHGKGSRRRVYKCRHRAEELTVEDLEKCCVNFEFDNAGSV